jgi:hypothetical protein
MMKLAEACEALNATRCVQFRYSGKDRVVEVHAAGYTREGKPIMRAWQVRGGSEGGDPSGWKLFRLDEISSVEFLEEKSKAPRNGYKRGDPAIDKLVCEI